MRPADAITNVTMTSDKSLDQQALDEIQTVIDQLAELSSPPEVPNPRWIEPTVPQPMQDVGDQVKVEPEEPKRPTVKGPKPGPLFTKQRKTGVPNPEPVPSTSKGPKPGPSGVVKRREPVPSTSKGPKPGQSTSKVKKNNAAGAFNPMYIAKNTKPETSVYKKIEDQKLYFSTKLFERMARAIQHGYITRYKEDHRNPTRTPLRFGDGVLDKIQFGFEQMIVEATTASFECTVHRNRTTIKRKDVEKAGKILESSQPFLHQP